MATRSKPVFKRQESWRYKRVAENWRRPRGVTSKMRKEESGWPAKVKVGYGSRVTTRDLHPRGLIDRLVWRELDLDRLDPKKHIVRIAASVGGKKRIGILDKANQMNFHIANPGRRETAPGEEKEERPVQGKTTIGEEMAENAVEGKVVAGQEEVEDKEEPVEAPAGTTAKLDSEEESEGEEEEEA